jgi:type IV secretory pathway VirB9-like protein
MCYITIELMKTRTPFAVLALVTLAACATQPPESSFVQDQPQTRKPVSVGDLRIPESQSDHLPPNMTNSQRPSERESLAAVEAANSSAMILPTLSCFSGSAVCRYWWEEDKPFRVNLAVADMTFVCAKPGEIITDIVVPGAQEWVVNERYSYGDRGKRRECAGLMPRGMIRGGVQAMMLTPDRGYTLDLQTYRNKRQKFYRVMWQYPEDELARLNGTIPDAAPSDGRDRVTGMHPRQRNCGYDISGGTPAWRPVPTSDGQPPVCDDGEVTIINFRPGVLGAYQSPTLQRLVGDVRKPVEYRRHNATYIVPNIHDALLLSIGAEEVVIRRKEEGK